MSDLRTSLEQRSKRGTPIGSEQLRQRVTLQLLGSSGAAPTQHRGWVIALVAAVFVLAVFGGLTVLLGGSEGSVPAADEGAPVAPPPTGELATPTDRKTVTTSLTEPSSPEVPPTTIRSSSIADIPMGPLDPDAWQTRWGVAPDGGFAAVYWHEADDEVRILRCKDATCTGSPEVVILGSVEPVSVEGEELGPYPVDLVFRPDGSPVVLMSGGESGAELSLYACKDQDCSDILTAPFDEGVRPTYGKLAVAPDGGLRVLYVDTETESLNLAVCADPVCEVIHSTMIVEQGIQIPSVPGIRIAPDGRTFIEYERDGASVQARVAVCNNPECSDGPTIFAFENAMTPRTMLSDDGRFFIWYRSGPFMIPDGDMDPEAISDSFRLMIAECNATACQQAQPVDVGWQTLWAWGTREDLRLLGTPDGGYVVPKYWSPPNCDFLFEVAKVNLETRTVDIVMGPTVGMPDAAADTSNGEPVLLRVSDDGKVSMINLSEVAPSESGPMVSKCTTP